MLYPLNSDKWERAEAVISGKRKFEDDSVEVAALKIAVKEKLEGREKTLRIYQLMGGAVSENTPEELKAKRKARR